MRNLNYFYVLGLNPALSSVCKLDIVPRTDLVQNLDLGTFMKDEKVFRCTVSTLAETARANQVTKTALITVGGFLGSDYDRSLLYDPGFSHGCREASR